MSDAHGATGDAKAARPAAWRRWLGIVLRTAHLAAVTVLGAALLAIECADGRIRLLELAGTVALAKLVLAAWMVIVPAHAAALFWILLVASALSSHAPRALRHWRPGSRARTGANGRPR